MKDAFYFSHDSNSRNDQKILGLRARYGARGYGVFFMIIEILREARDYQLPSKYEALAYDLREDAEIVKSVVEDFDLFTVRDGVFFSESLKNRMQKYALIVENRRKSGRLGGEANARQMLEQNRSKREAKKGKERKGKRRESEPLPSVSPVGDLPPIPLTDVQKIVGVFKVTSGYDKEDKAWDKLNFSRYAKSAKQLLDFLGDWRSAGNCIQDVYEKLNGKGLTVTLETICKHAADWKKDKQEVLG